MKKIGDKYKIDLAINYYGTAIIQEYFQIIDIDNSWMNAIYSIVSYSETGVRKGTRLVHDEHFIDNTCFRISSFPWEGDDNYRKYQESKCSCSSYDLLFYGHKCGITPKYLQQKNKSK